MRRVIAVLVALVAVAAATLAAQQAAPPPAQAGAPPTQAAAPAAQAGAPADEDWMPTEIKNLTVLPKDTSPQKVMEIMKAWNTVLNVDCVFCHVGVVGKPRSSYDFASDGKKRKETSRIMMRAVMALNESFKNVGDDPPEVTCGTCHKRSRHVDDKLPAEPPKEHD